MDKDRKLEIIELGETHAHEIKNVILHNQDQIRDKETHVVSWITLTVLFGVFQSVLTLGSRLTTPYLLSAFPTIAWGLFFASKTLCRHPNYIIKDFFTTEKKDFEHRLNRVNASIQGLSIIHKKMIASYDYKNKWSKFVGPAIQANIIVNIIFILVLLSFPHFINATNSSILGSISFIFAIYKTRHNISKTIKMTFSLGKNRKIIKKSIGRIWRE